MTGDWARLGAAVARNIAAASNVAGPRLWVLGARPPAWRLRIPHPSSPLTSPLSRLGRHSVSLGLGAGLAVAPLLGAVLLQTPPVQAQGTPGLMEFRWDNSKDYRKLYFFQTDTQRLKLSEYFLILRPKDRKTAILKLTVSMPKSFDSTIDPKRVKLCRMSEGGMLKRTRCEKQIPATVEVNAKAGTIEIFPETPVSDKYTIGVYMRIFNPFKIGRAHV
mgnify:CR=1 FL=1